MPPLPKPSAVIFAKDTQRLATFYSAVLDMPIKVADVHKIVLDGVAMQLVLHAIPPEIAADITITDPPEARYEVPIKLCLPVISLATARTKIEKAGGHFAADDKAWNGPGFRACDGYDPEGNVFQLREGRDS